MYTLSESDSSHYYLLFYYYLFVGINNEPGIYYLLFGFSLSFRISFGFFRFFWLIDSFDYQMENILYFGFFINKYLYKFP